MIKRVNEPIVRTKVMTISLQLKLCLSNFSRGIERQKEGYQDKSIVLTFTRTVDLFLIPYFFKRFSPIFKMRLTVKALIA